MASGLAPNFGAQLAFRFLAGLFECTPMTTFGGSMSNIFDPIDRTYAFPVCCTLSFLGPVLLGWKAKHLREITGDHRFMEEFELHQTSIAIRLVHGCSRPFNLFFREIMVALFTMYLVIVYIVLFGFLTGYDFIFGDTYGFSQRSVGSTFMGINVGFLIAFAMVRHIYFAYKKRLTNAVESRHGDLQPEERLWFAMYGAPWLPISLFWMGWTS